MKKNKKTTGPKPGSKPAPAPARKPTLLAAGFAFDFGGSLGAGGQAIGNDATGGGGAFSFDNTPRTPHDPFKMKPPSCPSMF